MQLRPGIVNLQPDSVCTLRLCRSIFQSFFLLMGGKKSCNDDRLDKSNYVSVVQIALSVFVSMFSVLKKIVKTVKYDEFCDESTDKSSF